MAQMTTHRLDIEYDGGGFNGWAAQAPQRTVQGELEAALATVLREPVQLATILAQDWAKALAAAAVVAALALASAGHPTLQSWLKIA